MDLTTFQKHAILYHSNLIHNLKLCNKIIADKSAVKESILINEWIYSFLNKDSNYWAYLSIILMFITAVFILIFYFGKNLTKVNSNKLNISFIMKKKVGNSVVRNKIKRRLRAAIQKKLKNKKFIDINYSYIIFGKSKAFTEKYSIISDELDKTFFKINQINN